MNLSKSARDTELKSRLKLSMALARRFSGDFYQFHTRIAAVGIRAVEGGFETGWHIKDICQRLQSNQATATEAFRESSKSVTIRSYLMFLLYNCDRAFAEYSYFSYKKDLAGYHLHKAKNYIKFCPFFNEFESISDADTILKYRTPKGNIWECQPEGILAFKRGIHRAGVFLDDILKDPLHKLDLGIIEKITRIVEEEVLAIPKKDGFIHLVGTPQHRHDLFARWRDNDEYNYKQYPAEVEGDNGREPTWPEMWPLDRLDKRRAQQGNHAYRKEMLLIPVRSEDSWFDEEQIEGRENPKLKNLKIGGDPVDYGLAGVEVIAGADLGKKGHPSHLAVFMKIRTDEKGENTLLALKDAVDESTGREDWDLRPDTMVLKVYEPDKKEDEDEEESPEAWMDDIEGEIPFKLIQIHSRWFDGVDYTVQLEYFLRAIRSFGIDMMYYDNTRAEFESMDEMGMIPRQMVGVVASSRSNYQSASDFDRLVTQKKIELLQEGRQRRMICIVDNDLKAPVTSEGHGDCFFSICNAILAAMRRNRQVDPGLKT